MVSPSILPSGSTDFSGGQNAGVAPHALPDNQYAIGVNVSCESTMLVPRWGIEEDLLDFDHITDVYMRSTGVTVTFEHIFYEGKFQGFAPYAVGPDKFVIYIVSGFIYLINLHDFQVSVMNPTDSLNVQADRINWSDAGNYFVIYDWPNYPFILDGINIRRADPALNEVPVAVLGTYNQNRLCIANAGIEWTAGDPSGSQATPMAPITFNEILTIGSPYFGDIYQIPTASKYADSITAMGFLQFVDTSTGIGPLIVSTAKSIYSYRTDLPRSEWQGGTADRVFGSMLLPTTGIVGQRAFTNVNADIHFLGYDNQTYALSMARNDQRRWGNSPTSREVQNFLELADRSIAFVGVAEYFKNKIMFTANPYRVHCVSAEGVPQLDYVNGGLVVMELDVNASLARDIPPIWTGLWTGVQFTDVAEVDGVLFISGKLEGKNRLFHFTPDKTVDVINGKERLIRSVVVTKEYESGDSTVNKELHSLDLGLRELEDSVTVNAEYRPSTTENFYDWGTVTYNVPVEQCDDLALYINGYSRQGIRDLTIGSTKEECLEGSNDISNVYKGVQLRFTITGKHWALEYVKIKSRVRPTAERETVCTDVVHTPAPRDCFNYWLIPELGC